MLFHWTAFAGVRSKTKVAQCASNLRQFTLAMHLYGNENDGSLPSIVGFWAWDIPRATGTFVESTGSKWTVMFCPGTSPPFTDADNWELYAFSSSYRVIGYATTFSTSALIASNRNTTLTPQPIEFAPFQFFTPLASERVLLADATISQYGQSNPSLRYTYNYTFIAGGFRLPHRSPHLTGQFPAGGNLGMLDGHVEWRDFADMYPRMQQGSGPGFWW